MFLLTVYSLAIKFYGAIQKLGFQLSLLGTFIVVVYSIVLEQLKSLTTNCFLE